MNQDKEMSHRARNFTEALGSIGINIRHTQALTVLAKLDGSHNWNTYRMVNTKNPPPQPIDLNTLARQHVASKMFETLGKWTLDLFFEEVAAIQALSDDSEHLFAEKTERTAKLLDSEHAEGALLRYPYYEYGLEACLEFFENEVEAILKLLEKRWFAPSVEQVDTFLTFGEKSHAKTTKSAEYKSEANIRTASGFQLKVPAYPEEVSYLRVCDPVGREVAYWAIDEVQESPAEVLGAIVGALRPNCLAIGSSTPVSSEDKIIIERRIQDWRCSDPDCKDTLSPLDEKAYRLQVADQGDGVSLTIAPRHRHPDELANQHQLDVYADIQHGLPCVTITNQLYGDSLLSIFGTKDGLILRRNVSDLKFSLASDFPLAKLLQAEDGLAIPNLV